MRKKITTKDEFLALRRENPNLFSHMKPLPEPEIVENPPSMNEGSLGTENRGNEGGNPAGQGEKGKGWISKALIGVILVFVINKMFSTK